MAPVFSTAWLTAARKRGYWRSAVALLAAFSFLLLVSASVTHVHKSSATIHDCAVCVVVADQLADTPVPPVLVHDLQLPDVALPALLFVAPVYATVQLLPPGRGPPSTSA